MFFYDSWKISSCAPPQVKVSKSSWCVCFLFPSTFSDKVLILCFRFLGFPLVTRVTLLLPSGNWFRLTLLSESLTLETITKSLLNALFQRSHSGIQNDECKTTLCYQMLRRMNEFEVSEVNLTQFHVISANIYFSTQWRPDSLGSPYSWLSRGLLSEVSKVFSLFIYYLQIADLMYTCKYPRHSSMSKHLFCWLVIKSADKSYYVTLRIADLIFRNGSSIFQNVLQSSIAFATIFTSMLEHTRRLPNLLPPGFLWRLITFSN